LRPTVPRSIWESFATIRAEADLARFTPTRRCGRAHASTPPVWSGLERARTVSENGADCAGGAADGRAILWDAHMVSRDHTHAFAADNQIICPCATRRVPDIGQQMGNTRSAAALELWRPHSGGGFGGPSATRDGACFTCSICSNDPDCPRPAAPSSVAPVGLSVRLNRKGRA